jgi:hypothetical protein
MEITRDDNLVIETNLRHIKELSETERGDYAAATNLIHKQMIESRNVWRSKCILISIKGDSK